MKNIGRIARIARVGRAGAVPVPHGQVEFTASGSGNWTVPTGVTRARMEVWGGGENGHFDPALGGGGGGGYAEAYVSLTPGHSLPYNVGLNNAYGDAHDLAASYVLPVGGTHGVNDLVSAEGGGGSGLGGDGTIGGLLLSGGFGGLGDEATAGGGGGGGAGHSSAGGSGGAASTGVGGTGGTGGEGTNSGGDGAAVTGNGAVGNAPGGGGGGGSILGTGGNGANGRVRITWPA